MVATLAVAWATRAEAAPRCHDDAVQSRQAGSRCPSSTPRKIEPYDPDRVRAGSRPGFIDLGGGTEIRIGGRARVDVQGRR